MATKIEIEQMKELARLRKKCNQVVPEIYACICKVLFDNGMDAETIEILFNETTRLWNELVDNDEMSNMIEWCEQTTGICLAER